MHGIALLAQQDDRVGQRLEPRLDRRFQCLQRLRIVVVDEGHHRVGPLPHERPLQEPAHVIVPARTARLVETVVQRHAERGDAAAQAIQVGMQLPDVRRPVLRNDEQVPAGVPLHGVQPLGKEPAGDVLHRVEPEAVDAGGVEVPFAPGGDLAPDLLLWKSRSQPMRKEKFPFSSATWSSNCFPSSR